jgi:cytosine deaminase
MDIFLQSAIEEAKKGLAAGGIPIGSVLVRMAESSGAAIISASGMAA